MSYSLADLDKVRSRVVLVCGPARRRPLIGAIDPDQCTGDDGTSGSHYVLFFFLLRLRVLIVVYQYHDVYAKARMDIYSWGLYDVA